MCSAFAVDMPWMFSGYSAIRKTEATCASMNWMGGGVRSLERPKAQRFMQISQGYRRAKIQTQKKSVTNRGEKIDVLRTVHTALGINT